MKAWTPDPRLPDGLYLREGHEGLRARENRVVRVEGHRCVGNVSVSRSAANRLEFLHGVPRIGSGLYAAIDAGEFHPVTSVRETVHSAGGLFSFTAVRILRGSHG